MTESQRIQRSPAQNSVAKQARDDPLLHQAVSIKAGTWKGYLGIVKDIIDNIVRVELHTNFKTVSIDKTKVELLSQTSLPEKTPSTPYRSGLSRMDSPASWLSEMGSRTPLREPMTPLRMSTPMRPSTPSTPLHDAWNPHTNTPLRVDNEWDANDNHTSGPSPYGSNSNISTPYSPAPYSFAGPSPRVNPTTPSRETTTPLSVYSPFTPSQVPMTPNTPATPSTPAFEIGRGMDSHYESEDIGGKEGSWQTTNIEVRFTMGQFKDMVGVIQELLSNNNCKVYVMETREVILAPGSHLAPVAPGRGDKIKVIQGQFKGQTRTIIRIHNMQEAVVQMDASSTDIKIVEMSCLARYRSV